MENKTDLKLIKEEVAKENGFKDWLDCFEVIGIHRLLHESFLDAVAKLYKEKATEELMKENEALKHEVLRFKYDKSDLLLKREIDTLMPEIERLTQSNKELVEALKHSLSMMEQTLSYRENTGLTVGNIFLSSTIEQAKHVIQKSKP